MRWFFRIAGIAILLVTAQQVLRPVSGSAQVDPCKPVPIPGLCATPLPGPSPSPLPGDILPGGDTKDQAGDAVKGGTEQATEIVGGGRKGSGGAKGGPQERGKPAEPVSQPPTPTGPFRVSSPNNSQALVDVLSQLEPYGIPLPEGLLRVAGPFPVAGLAYWTDDWHACRDGCSRLHEGLDIFAQTGTPLVATSDGFVSQKLEGELSGISIEITDDQGVQYFYAHLSAWAEPIEVGDRVEMGQVVGYVGNTGNAIYTPPHLHFEVQPGGIPVPPKPFVDRWLQIAEAEAQQLLSKYTGEPLPASSDFRLTRLFDLTGGSAVLDVQAERLLALAGIQPSVSSLEMARRLLGQMAWEIDWTAQADAELAALAREYGAAVGGEDLAGASPWAPLGSQPAVVPAHVAEQIGLEQGD
jgi:murein DD-endopeptidase MepM/ murein hydrolase activator NlpD